MAVSWYSGTAGFSSAATETLGTDQSLTGIDGTLGLAGAAFSITSTSLPGGTQSASYSATMQASGGTGPYVCSASGLPFGLSINSTTGVISGAAVDSGTFTASITVTDASPPSVSTSTNLSLTIASATPPSTTTTIAPPITKTVCTIKTKRVAVDTTKIVKGKKVVVVTHKTVRAYKTVTVKRVEKIHGKKVVVVTH